ncbi:MAG: hypothetical protein V3S55_11995 [Nitrospiraceae bacterium]
MSATNRGPEVPILANHICILGREQVRGHSRCGRRPKHPQVATGLENYAALLHKLNRDAEAGKMEARAKAIRAKHAQEIPQR